MPSIQYNWLKISSNRNKFIKDNRLKFRKICFQTCQRNEMPTDLNTTLTLKITQFPLQYVFNDLKRLFSCFGEVKVSFIPVQKDPSKRYGFVEFFSLKSLQSALSYESLNMIQPELKGSRLYGIDKWIAEYKSKRPNTKKLE